MPLLTQRSNPCLSAALTAALACACQGQTVRKAEPVPDNELYGLPDRVQIRRAEPLPSAAGRKGRRDPYQADAVAERAFALCEAGRSREAVEWLMDLKSQYLDFFPHQLALADAFAAARMFGDAAAAYEVVAADPGYGAQQEVARARIRLMSRDRSLIAGEHAVRTGNPAAARRALALIPAPADDLDALALEAAVLSREGKPDEARALLDKVVRTGWTSRTVAEARLVLADSEARSGAWEEAAEDFRSVESDPGLTNRQQFHAAQQSRELKARVAPTVTHSMGLATMREGDLWTTGIEVASGAFGEGRNALYLRGLWDEVGLGHQQVISRGDVERWQTELAWRRLTGRGFYGELSAGAGDEGPVLGAAFGRYRDPAWQFSLRSGDRAADSLLLMALGGVQHSAAVRYQKPLGERWVFDAALIWRRVEIEDAEIADGVTLDFRLVRTLLEETPTRPAVTLAWTGHIQDMDRRRPPETLLSHLFFHGRRLEDPLDALLEDRINRHALVASVSKQFGARWTGFLYGGASYEFNDERAAAIAGAGLTAYLSPDTTLIFSLDYASSGDGLNEGHDTWAGFIRIRVSF